MKYVYYVSNLTITAYRWQANTIIDAARFNNNPAGLEQLSEWVAQQESCPSMILCDVIEEEFSQTQVPHASSGDLKLILQRKVKQAFRDTPFRLFRRQKAEKRGKQNINVTFSAITNPELLSDLLQILEKFRVPVSGIYTPASLCSILFKKLKCKTQYNLLVSQQDSHHMRLSYCVQKDIRSSRLSSTDYSPNSAYYHKIRDEAEKNQRYLKRMQLLPQSETPDAYIIGEEGLEDYCHEAFKEQYRGNYHYLPIGELCKIIGLKNTIRANQSDMLYVHLLCSTRSVNNYAPPKEKKYHYLSSTNKVFKAATIAGVILALSASIYNVLKGMELAVTQKQESSLRSVLLHNLALAKKSMPSSQVSASEMRAYVNAEKELRTLKVNPTEIMTGLSQIFTSFNDINIDELTWKVTRELPKQVRTPSNATPIGVVSRKRYQLITIKGHIVGFSGNYPSAQRHILALINKVQETGKYTRVLALKMPVNISSSSAVSGQSGSGLDDVKAEFTLILIKSVGDKKS